MAIRKYFARADTTISNAYKADFQTIATGSNMGLSDILEVFFLYNQIDDGSEELSRILIKFDIEDIYDDREEGTLPAAGDVEFRLKLYNAEHGNTLPTNYHIEVFPITKHWDEGHGLDMEEYTDPAANGEGDDYQYGGTGASWTVAASGANWDTEGGDFEDAEEEMDLKFETGLEDLDIDITTLVEEWIEWLETDGEGEGQSGRDNLGIIIKLDDNAEGLDEKSYYTKKFFARGTQFYYKRPTLEARWDSSRTDNRLNLATESPFLTDDENTMTMYYYHSVRGALSDIAGDDEIVPLFALATDDDLEEKVTINLDDAGEDVTCERIDVGVYRAQFKISSDIEVETLYEKWWTDDEDTLLRGVDGSQTVSVTQYYDVSPPPTAYVTALENLQSVYSVQEEARIRLFIRSKDWSPTIYTVANSELNTEVVEEAHYRIVRVVDELVVIDWDGSSTKLSYDEDGCYFDFQMGLLEAGWQYRIEIAYIINGETKRQPETFKFRVE